MRMPPKRGKVTVQMAIQYGTLKNANVTIDGDGLVWLWIVADSEHVGINLSAALPHPNFDETLKTWARDQEQRTSDVPNSRFRNSD